MAFGGCNGSMGVPGSTGLAQSGWEIEKKREEKVNYLLHFLNYNRETIIILVELPAGCIVYWVTNLQITLFRIALFV